MAVLQRRFWIRETSFPKWILICVVVVLVPVRGMATSMWNSGVPRSATLFPLHRTLVPLFNETLLSGDGAVVLSRRDTNIIGTCHCSFEADSGRLTCTNLTSFQALVESLNASQNWCNTSSDAGSQVDRPPAIDTLVISHSAFSNFSPTFLDRFPTVKRLLFRHNDFQGDAVVTPPAQASYSEVQVLDLSSNNLTNVSRKFLGAFPQLQTIHLSDNKIQNLTQNLFNSNKHLTTIYLRGNPLLCESNEWFFYWIRTSNVTVEERNQTSCGNNGLGSTTFDYLIDHCPINCTCVQFRGGIRVNCSSKGYHSFPAKLPKSTQYLNMENNQIDGLQSLRNGSNYNHLLHLFLDNNSISSIYIAERIDFFKSLTILSISGNRLTKLPAHIIENFLSRSLDQVSLANNPWKCECHEVAPFHSLLMKYEKKFRDVDEIRCDRNGPHHPNQVINQLSKHDICFSGIYIDPLDIMNVCMVIVILLIVAKVLYDYRRLKQTGQMPVGPFNCYSTKSTHSVS